jgi:hypothetical protein
VQKDDPLTRQGSFCETSGDGAVFATSKAAVVALEFTTFWKMIGAPAVGVYVVAPPSPSCSHWLGLLYGQPQFMYFVSIT